MKSIDNLLNQMNAENEKKKKEKEQKDRQKVQSNKPIQLDLNDSLKKHEQKRDNARNSLEQKKTEQKKKKSVAPPKVKKKEPEERDGLLGFLDRTVGRASHAAHDAVFGEDFVKKQDDNYRKNTKNQNVQKMVNTTSREARGALEKGSDITGAILGEIAPYTVGYGAADKVLKVGKGLNAIKNPIAREFARGSIAGGVVGTGKAVVRDVYSDDEYGTKDYAKQIGFEAALGGAADAGVSAAVRGISKLKGLKQQKQANLLPKVESKPIDKPKLAPELDTKRPKLLDDLFPKLPKSNPIEKPELTPFKPIQPKPETKAINDEIINVTRQLEETKTRPLTERVTKTNIDDQLRSLEINDGYLNSSRRNKQISDEDFLRKSKENEAKRQRLLEQQKQFTKEVPEELKPLWNNATKGFELGDYITKKNYGGGFIVQKEGNTLQKFRTEEEAKRFMQKQVATENGSDINHDVDGVLSWNSTFDDVKQDWDIKAGDYTIDKVDKNAWVLKHKDKVVGRYKNEKKAREEAQRHYDVNTPTQAKEVVEPPPMKPQQAPSEAVEQSPSLRTIKIGKNLEDATPDEVRSVYQHLVEKKERLLVADKGADEGVYYRQLEAVNDDIETVKKILTSAKTSEQNPPFVTNPLVPNVEKAKQVDPAALVPNVQKPEAEMQALKPNERRFYENVGTKEKTSPELLKLLSDADKSYTPMSNKETVDFANSFIENDIEKAYQFVKNAKRFDPRHVTVGHRLIDEFQARGEFDRALDVVERLAEQGTKAGQSVQAYSIYGRLTAQGQLLRAQRIVNRINSNIVREKNKVKLDETSIQDITHAADSIQRLTGQQEVAKNVMNIMDSLKKGVAATDDDLEIIGAFVEDAKKFIGDTTPKKERVKIKPTVDVRTRDKVVDFMGKQEEAAKQRLKAKMNRVNSLPVDIFYDLTVIGASKIAKGTVKFADFAEQMVQEFGEEYRPYMKQIWDKSAENYNKQSEAISNKRLSEVEKIVNKATKDKTLTEEEAGAVQAYLKEYLQLTGDAKLEASMQLQSTLQLLERPSFAQKISTAQTIAQLLNPKTIVRNAIGNELFYRVEQLNKLAATPIDIAKSKIFGTERTVTFRSHNQGQYWHNWMLGLKAGWKGVNPMGLQTMYDLGPQAFRSKYNPMTYLEKSLGAVLRSFDNAGYMRAYNKTLGEIATLKAMNEGLKGPALKEAVAKYIREADENMMNIADQYSKYATFQDNTVLATWLQKGKGAANYISTLGATKEFGLGDLILKYPKTPGNLIMRALEYSPAGFVRSAHLIRRAALSKNPMDQRETVLALTRAITGTFGFSMMGYVLADKGILTSSGHSDFEVNSLERQAGKQANSINITALQRFVSSGFDLKSAEVRENDTFISYDWAQPVSLAVALGTGVSQSQKEEEELNPIKAGQKAFDSATQTIIDMSVLSGLNDFLANYPGRTNSDRLVDAGKGIASSFVPTFSNQIRQLSDNTSRTTYSPDVLQETLNKAQNRVPGVEQSLPIAYSTLGKQRENYQNGSNNAFNVFLNPSFVSKYKPSKEAQFVLDYINETGDKNKAPRLADKKIDGIPLTGEQYSKYQRLMGEETQRILEIVADRYEGADHKTLEKVLDKVLREAGRYAKDEMRKELVK